MPMHDWTKVYAGIFHSFHQAWVSVIAKQLNMGRLPQNLYALAEQQTQKEKQKRYVPDILTLESSTDSGGVMTAPRLKKPKPKAMIESYSELEIYRRKKSVIGIRHVSHHRLIAVLEIVSPGNKSGRKPLAELVRKTAAMLNKTQTR